MTIDGKRIIEMVEHMQVGTRTEIDGIVFDDAFPCGFPSIYQTSVQHFLSNFVGSAWGRATVERQLERQNYIISRNGEDLTKRVYVDPDREHLFQRMPNGSLERK